MRWLHIVYWYMRHGNKNVAGCWPEVSACSAMESWASRSQREVLNYRSDPAWVFTGKIQLNLPEMDTIRTRKSVCIRGVRLWEVSAYGR